MQNTEYGRVSLDNLAQEIASLLADSQFGLWEELSATDAWNKKIDMSAADAEMETMKVRGRDRRMAATALFEVGCPELGVSGVTPNILRLIESGEISVRSRVGHLPPSKASDVLACFGCWYLIPEDADKVKKLLLPEEMLTRLKFKESEGRYTIEEAASYLEEAVFGRNGDEDEGCDETDFLDALMKAVLEIPLPVYIPGKNERYQYGEKVNTEVREFFEEIYWYDLNEWLATSGLKIEFMFPDPSPCTDTNSQDRQKRGVTKQGILACDWPLSRVRSFPLNKVPTMKSILDEIPKWVGGACNKVGRRGRGAEGSHLWNPAMLALCLYAKTTHKKWSVDKRALTIFISQRYPEYLEEWECLAENLLNPGVDTGRDTG